MWAGAAEPRSEISTSDAHATVKQGEIAGYSENGIYIYKGIPYAKAERFMPPKAADAWQGVRSCRNYGPTCPQDKRQGWQNDEIAFAFNWDDGYPGEDCLRANVWTPAKTADGKKRPVMVWLHGGGFAAGSGQELPGYDGANLARKGDVVVVTLNHRLNVLGFLDLSDFGPGYASSGNAGLLDLVAALEWVRDNAEAFGGDPSNVTIFGQSGGGGKVSTLCATPAAKGLFHKAIVQSGSILSTMTSEQSRRIGREVVKQLGLENDVKKLSTIPYEQLLAAGSAAVATVRKQLESEGGIGGAFILTHHLCADAAQRRHGDGQKLHGPALRSGGSRQDYLRIRQGLSRLPTQRPYRLRHFLPSISRAPGRHKIRAGWRACLYVPFHMGIART